MSSSTYWADRVRVSWSHSVRTPMYFLRRTPCPASYLDPDNVTVMWAPAKGTVVRAALFVFPDKHLTQFPIDFRLSICVWHTAKNLFVPRKKSFQTFVLSLNWNKKTKMAASSFCFKSVKWICCQSCLWRESWVVLGSRSSFMASLHMLVDAHAQEVGTQQHLAV